MSDHDDNTMQAIADAVHGDIATRLTALDGNHMLVRHLTIADVMDDNGQRAVVLLATKDMQAWESLGMLEYARQVEQVGVFGEETDDD